MPLATDIAVHVGRMTYGVEDLAFAQLQKVNDITVADG
jgi:hypothetical protein